MKFLHTADWQLGKPFGGVEDLSKRTLLQQQRLAVLDRIADVAQSRGAEFILVAGDVFDSPTATKSTISAACAAIGRMKIPVYVIPGNHDHGGPGSLWEQSYFLREQQQLAPNLHLLLEPKPFDCGPALIFPCPLLRRHESSDLTAWLQTLDLNALPAKPRIVLAHGSIQDFGASQADEDQIDTAVNHLDITRLDPQNWDYVALGDWHGTKKVGVHAWYSGTPELDRFQKGSDHDPGNVLVVDTQRGTSPAVESVRIARFAWHERHFTFSDDQSLDHAIHDINAALGNRAQEDLLLLTVEGTLGIAAMTRLEEILESLQARLLRLKLTNRAAVAPSQAELEELTLRPSDPLIARVAAALVGNAKTDGSESAVARIALRELHALATQN